MIITDEIQKPIDISAPAKLIPRDVQFGQIYDKLEPNRPLNIALFGKQELVIDEENLDLERVTRENLEKQWESRKEAWTKQCKELGIDIDPFKVFTYYSIQKKAFQILGAPTTKTVKRDVIYDKHGGLVKLSQMKGMAMCSEYAALETYIAQKIGEPAHLVLGTTITGEKQWREAHMFTWIEGIDSILEGTLATENEFPALMVPSKKVTLETLEKGYDVECKRIGTNHSVIYGLEAGGFGTKFVPDPPASLQEATQGL